MGRPIQEVKVFGVQDRRSTAQAKLPWIVRRSIEGPTAEQVVSHES